MKHTFGVDQFCVKDDGNGLNTNAAKDAIELYKNKSVINILNIIILINMFYYILKMHSFQARLYFEKINTIYNNPDYVSDNN